MKAIKAKLETDDKVRVEVFEKGAQAFAKKVIANFKDYEFVSNHPVYASIGSPDVM